MLVCLVQVQLRWTAHGWGGYDAETLGIVTHQPEYKRGLIAASLCMLSKVSAIPILTMSLSAVLTAVLTPDPTVATTLARPNYDPIQYHIALARLWSASHCPQLPSAPRRRLQPARRPAFQHRLIVPTQGIVLNLEGILIPSVVE